MLWGLIDLQSVYILIVGMFIGYVIGKMMNKTRVAIAIAEQARKIAEEARKLAEYYRVKAEAGREIAEEDRQDAENGRKGAEDKRKRRFPSD